MTRTLRRLARIQRMEQDEARSRLLDAEMAEENHREVLEKCHHAIERTLNDVANNADELMRRHTFSLRQELHRRRLQHEADALRATVETRRESLRDAVRSVETTERFTELLEAQQAQVVNHQRQRTLDEVGLMSWARSKDGRP